MSYTPETQWVGVQPVVHPKNIVKPHRPVGSVGRSIIATATQYGPCSAVSIAEFLNLPIDSVRNRLLTAVNVGHLTRHEGLHPNGKTRIMFYSGLQ